MLTPIDFGKRFLINFFSDGDVEACLKAMSEDVVWIIGDDPHHLRGSGEIRAFLQEEADRRRMQGRRDTDIASMMSSPGPEKALTISYAVNLVSQEGKETERYDCSMVICRNGQRNEVTFLHFSKRDPDDPMKPILEFMNIMPCGVMILSVTEKEGMRILAFNDYFCDKLRYTRVIFDRNMQDEPFFMSEPEDRERIEKELKSVNGTDRNFSLNISMHRKDGQSFLYRMNGALAYRGKDEHIYYCVFHEITGFQMMNDQLRDKYEISQEILKYAPGAFCTLRVEKGADSPQVIYTSSSVPELFGCSANQYSFHVRKDPFYELNMTSVTRDRLQQEYIEKDTDTVSAGMYDVVRSDNSTYRIELFITSRTDEGGNRWIFLNFSDREAQQEELREQVNKAERMAHIQVEKAREDARNARRKAKEEVEASRAELQTKIAEEKAGMQKLLDIRKFDYERMEQKLQKENEDLRKELEEKKKELYEKINRLQTQLAQARVVNNVQAAQIRQITEGEAEKKKQEKKEEEKKHSPAEEAAGKYLAQVQKIHEIEHSRALNRVRVCEDQLREAQESGSKADIRAAGMMAEDFRAIEKTTGTGTPTEMTEMTSAERASFAEKTSAGENSVDSVHSAGTDFTGGGFGESGAVPAAAEPAEVTFNLEDTVKSVLLYVSIGCREEGIGLVMIKDKGMSGSFVGDKINFQKSICYLLENSEYRCKRGESITLSCHQEHAAEGRKYLYIHIRDEGKEIPARSLQTLFESKEIPEEELDENRYGLYSAREAIRRIGGRIQVLNRGVQGNEFIVRVPLRVAGSGQ